MEGERKEKVVEGRRRRISRSQRSAEGLEGGMMAITHAAIQSPRRVGVPDRTRRLALGVTE